MKQKKIYRSPDFAKYVVTYLLDLKEESVQAKGEKKALEKMIKSGELSREEKRELRVSFEQSKILHQAMKAIYETAKEHLGFYSIGSKIRQEEEPEEKIEQFITTAPAVKVEKTSKKPSAKQKTKAQHVNVNDLTLVEGIGPKIQDILNQSGIFTFQHLSESSFENIKKILTSAGPRFNIHNPKTWIEQATLACNDQWDELRALQNELKGGKE
ncbi:MAG: hypothetical protein WAT79_04045 [Saprospiraceae bacterium]